MDYANKIPSLEEMSSAQVAIHLCQENELKEIALLLEKPTYGAFVTHFTSSHPDIRFEIFVSDPEKLSAWDRVKKNHWRFITSYSVPTFPYLTFWSSEKLTLWDAAIEEQCQRLLEGIPSFLRQGVLVWVPRIALEYLSYSRRQEVLFGVSRYFLMDVLTGEDCTKSGRLDEKKLALKLLQDERLTVLQRYRIACAYCLHLHIPKLWMGLTQEEKRLTTGEREVGLPEETHDLVLLWSRHMDGEEEESQTNHLWAEAARKATLYGNRAALMVCWEKLDERVRRLAIFDMVRLCLRSLEKLTEKSHYNRSKLVSDEFHVDLSGRKIVDDFNLPSYHRELVRFFLSQMDEEQRLKIFREAFHSSLLILECFLDWPHQDVFIPTMNRLWGIMPKDQYGQCLLTLSIKYSRSDGKKKLLYRLSKSVKDFVGHNARRVQAVCV